MYTTIRHYNVTADSAREMMTRAFECFVPIISKSSGFVSYALVNTGSDTVTTISTFENQTGMEKSNELAATWANYNLAGLAIGSPIIIGGLVGGYMSAK
jgi:hypothetical protein